MAIFNIIITISFKEFLKLIGSLLLVYTFQFYYNYYTRPNKLPGPLPLPFIGNTYLYKSDTKSLFTSLREKYGDIYEVYFGGQRRVVISRPDYFEKILISSNKFFKRYPHSKGIEEYGLTGVGIIHNDNLKSWKFNRQSFTRSIMTPEFNNEAIKLTSKIFQELEGYWKSLANVNLSNNNLQDNKNKWSLETDLSKWMRRFTNDIIVIISTGKRSYSMASYYNKLSPIKIARTGTLIEDSEKLLQAFRNFSLNSGYFFILGSFLRQHAPIIKDKVKEILENRDFIMDKFNEVIKNRRKEIEETPIGSELRHDMLTSLITVNTDRDIKKVKAVEEDMSRPMTDKEIGGNLFDVLMGGTDTTANLFCFIVYYLCHFPQVKQKMLSEIESVFPLKSNFDLKHDDLSKLKYCEAIIKEVNRCTPLISHFTRYSDSPCEMAGHQWEAGTLFLINLASVYSHKDYWPDPNTFNPDRFYNEKSEEIEDNSEENNKIRHRYSFAMFGGGLRICPGKKLAMIELLSLMVLLFRHYDVELVDMKMPLKLKSATASACEELMVKIKPRIRE
ncbi:cytochrome P450 [Gigaspora margarita]|uniref:Cytochrome P450 n=1 Tax=Gigaspora margarita TaxID=4874 RepID=A0A8H4A1B0_GIGMA|nr:cytochrome P450 [Gigaspora margarita]